MALTITSNKEGRLTIPAEVRAALRIEGEAHWTAEVVEGALVLRPALVIPREDAWAYTPEHLAKVARAQEHTRAGRTIDTSPEELQQMADLPDEALTVEIDRLRTTAAQGTTRA